METSQIPGTAGTPASTPLHRALETIRRLKAKLDSQGATQPLAVVGVGLRFPGGIDGLETYWQALAEGRDLVRAMPEARRARFAADWTDLPQRGGFLDEDEVTGFDAGFFGISPREARALDPQHRLLLEVTWEALENAAMPADRLARFDHLRGTRTGLYIGITGQDYRDWQTGAPDVYWATGNGHCFAAGRLAYAMGFTGPALAVDTACSSALVAVHLACQALRRGECEVAVAGGVNLVLSPRSTRMIQATRALAPDGRCKAFDARANGYTRGEGCGVVILKRLDRALRDGDHIHAVIRGSAVNQDGRSTGFTAPNVLSQVALIEAALADADLRPADIGYVEAHGTGTALGDPIEMEALVAALGRRNGGAPLYVGSVKTNLGHLEAAAGLAGLVKAIACCAHGAIPALVHYRTLNPRIDLSGTGIQLPTTLVPWAAAAGASGAGRFAGVSSFGMSGTNAHLIVGRGEPGAAHPVQPAGGAPPAVTGFEIAARTPEALRALATRFRDALAVLPDERYGAFAYTATFGRARHAVRARVAASDKLAALSALDAIARGTGCAAVTFGASEHPLEEPPRCVLVLPHYPWERAPHVPEAQGPVREAHVPEGVQIASRRGDVDRETWTPGSRSALSVATTRAQRPVVPSPERAALLALPSHDRCIAVRDQVRQHAARILGHRDASAVREDASLFDHGLDSLMAVDLSRVLSSTFEIELSFTQIFARATVRDLAAVIVAGLPPASQVERPAQITALRAPQPSQAPRPSRTSHTSRGSARTTGHGRSPRVAFLFSCQGGQAFGMGRELYETEPVFRARIDASDRILAPLLGVSLGGVMMHGADPEAIHETRVTQPALVAFELALAELWNSWGVSASVVMGHSLGEVAAAIHAGVMDLASGLTLTAHRAHLMQAMAPGAMLAVRASLAQVTAWLDGTGLDVAAINGPDAIVVSGARDAVDALAARLDAAGVTARPIAVSLASHSRLMEPMLPAFEEALAGIAFRAPALPIMANLTGQLAEAATYDARYWCRHVREPVRFHDGARTLRASGIDVCLEIGPDRTLVNLVTAAGLLPAGGGVASLVRGAGERASFLDAVVALGELGRASELTPLHRCAASRSRTASRTGALTSSWAGGLTSSAASAISGTVHTDEQRVA